MDQQLDRLIARLDGTEDDLWLVLIELNLAGAMTEVEDALAEAGLTRCYDCRRWCRDPKEDCRCGAPESSQADFEAWADRTVAQYNDQIVRIYDEKRHQYGNDTLVLLVQAHNEHEPASQLYVCTVNGADHPFWTEPYRQAQTLIGPERSEGFFVFAVAGGYFKCFSLCCQPSYARN